MPKAKRFTADIEGFEGFPQRLQELIDLLGARQLADKSGVARTTLSSYVDGTAPGMDKLINIVKGSGVSFSWLAFGKGPMFLNEADTPASLLSSQKLQNTTIDMLTVYRIVEHYESKIRKKGKTYKPKQVASAITLLCIIGYLDISKIETSDMLSLIETLEV